MAARFDHTIVWCRDKQRSSAFLTGILGLSPAESFLDFLVVRLANGVSLDFADKEGDVAPQHYAFLVSEEAFDAGYGRIKADSVPHWADPARERPDEINRHWGGRGVYFEDPDGHLMEMITTPYGSEEEL